jgi:Dodecin
LRSGRCLLQTTSDRRDECEEVVETVLDDVSRDVEVLSATSYYFLHSKSLTNNLRALDQVQSPWVTDLVGTSKTSWDDAIRNAVETASPRVLPSTRRSPSARAFFIRPASPVTIADLFSRAGGA